MPGMGGTRTQQTGTHSRQGRTPLVDSPVLAARPRPPPGRCRRRCPRLPQSSCCAYMRPLQQALTPPPPDPPRAWTWQGGGQQARTTTLPIRPPPQAPFQVPCCHRTSGHWRGGTLQKRRSPSAAPCCHYAWGVHGASVPCCPCAQGARGDSHWWTQGLAGLPLLLLPPRACL
jgi:hypothetical protein